jgi:hypothetical protein
LDCQAGKPPPPVALASNENESWPNGSSRISGQAYAKVNGSSGMPAKFKHLLWISKVHDDEGNFLFDKLPPGKYLTWVNFDFYKNRTIHARTGNATVTTINNQVIGVQQEVYASQVKINQEANIEQTVVISKNGDAAVIELKKTKFLDIN